MYSKSALRVVMIRIVSKQLKLLLELNLNNIKKRIDHKEINQILVMQVQEEVTFIINIKVKQMKT